MRTPRWMVGPAVATLALAALGFPPMALFASGGGILIAAGVSFWIGAGAASLTRASQVLPLRGDRRNLPRCASGHWNLIATWVRRLDALRAAA